MTERSPAYLPDTPRLPKTIGPDEVRAIRRRLLDIKAQTLQIITTYDQARPRVSADLGWALARIQHRILAAADAIEVELGIREKIGGAR
jgi:hypothetical protein